MKHSFFLLAAIPILALGSYCQVQATAENSPFLQLDTPVADTTKKDSVI
jgi:hypothetical protein